MAKRTAPANDTTEQAAIARAIGWANVKWAGLEASLCNLFLILASLEKFHIEVGGIIFHTPNNFETRLVLVDNLMKYHLSMKGVNAAHRIYPLWIKIQGKIRRKQTTRNAIVHGAMIFSIIGTSSKVRVAPALLDVMRQQRPARQHPGFSPNDIEQFAGALNPVIEQIIAMTKIMDHYLGSLAQTRPGDSPELHELVTRLEAALKIAENNRDQS